VPHDRRRARAIRTRGCVVIDGVRIVLVVAIGENGVIGRNGALPWHLKSELQHFKRVTLNHPVVMGRKTFQSLRRPLPQRTNIVLTRSAGEAQASVIYASDLDEALALARADAKARGVDAVMVIGGSDVFARTLPIADQLELTRVHASPEGDVWFPALDEREWRVTHSERHAHGPDDEFDYTIKSFAEATQKTLTDAWDARHVTPESRIQQGSGEYLDTSANEPQLEHHKNFYRSIREGQPLIEDPTFGLRAAAPALLTNESLFQRKIMTWDPKKLAQGSV